MRKSNQAAKLTKKGYLQLYDLGVQFQKDYLSRFEISSFRKAYVKTHASARTRCTDSASGFLDGVQSTIQEEVTRFLNHIQI
jgi:hypothetical protein